MAIFIKEMEKTGFCKEHGCLYFHEPDIDCEPECCFAWFDGNYEHGACHDFEDDYIRGWMKKRR